MSSLGLCERCYALAPPTPFYGLWDLSGPCRPIGVSVSRVVHSPPHSLFLQCWGHVVHPG